MSTTAENPSAQPETEMPPSPAAPKLTLLSIVIPARDEEGCIASTVGHLHLELSLNKIPHNIVVVDDGSKDRTWEILTELAQKMPELQPVQNKGPHGFGANSHKHYGHMGIDMLAFKAEADNTGYLDGISFNAMTRDLAKTDLQEDFSKAIHTNHSDGIKFLELAKKYSNRTIANHELLAEVINQLVALNELKITGPSGKSKRSLSINNEDIILPCKQLSLFQPKKKII